MDTWPFSSISPENFALLTEQEIALFEVIIATFLAFVHARDATKQDSMGPAP
ncbi:hypothetical protein [Achromobacter sp.]|uniref:hypothetical protein n=1 Tax=Achromobacter sp. TaxID=134375 RepID=UPI0028ABF8CB|nr:hypothetical protein [Achromobacter sp.]